MKFWISRSFFSVEFECISSSSWQSFFGCKSLIGNYFLRYQTLVGNLFSKIVSSSWQSFLGYKALVGNHFLRYRTLVGSLFSKTVSSSWQSFFKIRSFSWQSFSKIWSFSWQLFSKRQNDKESTCYMSVKLGWVSKIL